MGGRTFRCVLVAAALALTGERGAAREVVRSDMSWTQPNAQTLLALPVAFGSPRRGFLSFDLQRLPGGTPEKPQTLFELLDGSGARILRWKIAWSSVMRPDRPALIVENGTRGSAFGRGSVNYWSPAVLLDRKVDEGQKIHVDVTWDDEENRFGILVDGRALNAHPGGWDLARKTFVPDRREVANRKNAAAGRPPAFPPQPFGTFLAGARTLELGNYDDPVKAPNRERSLLTNAALSNLVITVDEPLADLHSSKHDVNRLKAVFENMAVVLRWSPPEIHGMDQQYAVYRRGADEAGGRFERLTTDPVRTLAFVDKTAAAGRSYRYSVASVYSDLRGGYLEGKYPPEVTATAADVAIEAVSTERASYGAGQEIAVTLRGTPDLKASYTLGELVKDGAMEEVADGVYLAKTTVPAGANGVALALTGTLEGAKGNVTRSGAPVALDTSPPEPVERIVAGSPWAGENPFSWQPSGSPDVAEYRVYRGEGTAPSAVGPGFATVVASGAPAFVDTRVVPGLEYQYAVVAVDKARNPSPPSAVVKLRAVGGDGPKLTSVAADSGARPVRPGGNILFAVTGESGGTVQVTLGTLAAAVPLTEQGRTGRYVGFYPVTDRDVAPAKGLHRVVARLEDALGSSTLAGPVVAIAGRDGLNDNTPPPIVKASHDGWKAAGLCGKLVAGDRVTVSLEGEPGAYASFELSEVAGRVAMEETSPGVYGGSFAVPEGAAGSDVPVTVYLADDGGNETAVVLEQKLAFDTRLRLTVTARDRLLPADRASRTTVTAKAADANGKPLPGRELALTLSTTEEYTGVVGGGAVAGKAAASDDVDDVEVRWGGRTDSFGEVSADYTAGFAAKTALLIAKDLATGDVGAGWLNTYVASTIAVELTPTARKAAVARAVLRMTAEPSKLTADGRSTSRIKVWATDLAGAALVGARVCFALAGSNGTLRVLQEVTDAKGVATAEYRAGTALGAVTVTASSLEYSAAASLQLVLMSDAPAKVDLAAGVRSLPANGAARTTLTVRVSDLHDNPNDQVPVTFTLLQGTGSLSSSSLLTNRNGEGAVSFTAGRTAGTAVIEARHTSRAPSADELRRIYGTVFVPRWYDRQEKDRVTLTDWLVETGDKVTKGMALATVDTKTGTRTLTAPNDGVFVRRAKHGRDRVELGDTVGYVEIDPAVWKRDYAP